MRSRKGNQWLLLLILGLSLALLPVVAGAAGATEEVGLLSQEPTLSEDGQAEPADLTGAEEAAPADADRRLAVLTLEDRTDDSTAPADEITSWAELKTALAAGGSIQLTQDISCNDQNLGPLEVPEGVTAELDLNGHIIDRGLRSARESGYVIRVKGGLTITDSAPATAHESTTLTGGLITGGDNYSYTKDGGGVAVVGGSLVMTGGTVTGNKEESRHGGGIYAEEASVRLGGTARVTGNSATYFGGGVYVTEGKFTLAENARVDNNGASDGGVYLDESSSEMTGGVIEGNSADSDGGGLYVDYGDFTMSGGVIQGNTAWDDGGGVYVIYGTFAMTGGVIRQNRANDYGAGIYSYGGEVTIAENAEISKNQSKYDGGGVYMYTASFTMSGGVIQDNEAGTDGGGLYLYYFEEEQDARMTGGVITENRAGQNGGGVVVERARFTLADGVISENRATGEWPTNINYPEEGTGNGGGVVVRYSDFTMSGGSIKDNVAGGTSDNSADVVGYGGGVFLQSGLYSSYYEATYLASFAMRGGEISGNTAQRHGGGLYVQKGEGDGIDPTFQLSGPAKVLNNQLASEKTENVYLPAGMVLTVDGGLTRSTRLGVTTPAVPTAANPVFITKDLGENGVTANFFSDDPSYAVGLHENGEAVLTVPVTVTFLANDGSAAPPSKTQAVPAGMAAQLDPNTFTRAGHAFTGWNTEADGSGRAYGDEARLTLSQNIILYAQWVRNSSGREKTTNRILLDATGSGMIRCSKNPAVKGDTVLLTVIPNQGWSLGKITATDKNGKPVALYDRGNGLYSFVMPGSGVTVEASFTEQKPDSAFADVPKDAYFAAAVDWAVAKGVTNGVSHDLFAPFVPCTRGQMVAFLWRVAGSPKPGAVKNPFADVEPEDYYYQAVLWAVETGVAKGVAPDAFAPNDTVTRCQCVAFLYRYIGVQAQGTNPFTDVARSAYYYDAVTWAAAKGITTGKTPTLFAPDDPCTRGQIVTFLYRTFGK